MGATTVSATILGVDNQPIVGAYVHFRLKSVGTDSAATSTIDQDPISAITDASGQFSQVLWDNGDSGITSVLEIRMPSGQRIDVIIPAATATIDLYDLIENHQVGTADPQLPTNEALFAKVASNLSDMASAPTSRTNLGVAIGSDVQAYSAVLAATTASFLIADETKLDGIEALADVTDATNVTAAGALMDSELASVTAVKATTGTFLTADQTKLDGIEALADVTDATNVAAAGAYIAGGTDVPITDGGTGASTAAQARTNLGVSASGDSLQVANNLSDVASAVTSRSNLGLGTAATTAATAYATSAQGTLADAALPKTGGAMTGAITTSDLIDGRDVATDGTKLDGIEALADVTNAASVVAAGGYIVGGTDVALADGGTGASTATTARTNLEFPTNATGAVTPVTITSYTVLTTDHTLTVDETAIGGNVTINLLAAATAGSGFELTVKKTGSTFATTIDGSGTETIDGALTQVMSIEDSTITIASNGTSWDITHGQGTGIGNSIGTTVQAWDADLDTISALSPSQYDVIEWSGSAWAVRDGGIHGSEIIVRSASDLSGALDSTKVYVIDGVVEMGTQTITVPDGGLEIRGLGLNVSRLSSAENTYTMFVDSASNAGNLFLTNLSIDVRGTGSKVWDLDNTSNSDPSNAAVELNAINFENCTEIGTLTGYRQWLLQNSFWISCDDGVTFAGAWAGGAFNSTLLVRNFDPVAGGGAVFKGAAGMTFASRFYSNANVSTPTGATVYDFEAAMFTGDAGFELINGQYSGAGTVVSVQTPVIDHTSTKSRFRDNNGLENTYVGGRWFIDTGDAVDTVIAITGTYVKVAGTTTPDDLQWMSLGTANNLTYDSTRTIRAEIKGSINVSAASGGTDKNVTLTLRHWDNSASAYVDLEGVAKGVSTSASTFHNLYVQGYVELDTSDRIELWVQNDTDTVDISIDEGSSLSIVERAN